MNNEIIHTPHDRFLRKMMQSKEIAQEFFSIHLPENIKNDIDLNSIELQSNTFIESNLRGKTTDLLFSTQFQNSKREGYIYTLVEHQSTASKIMPFRMLKYMTLIMERHLRIYGGETLPIIVPLVVYSGRYPYKYSMDILDLFGSDNKELAAKTLLKPCKLIDFSKLDENKFKQFFYHSVIVKTMKSIFEENIYLAVENTLMPYLIELAKHNKSSYIETILYYIFEAGETITKEEIELLIKSVETKLSKEYGEKVMTIANTLRQEGRQEGEQIGYIKGLECGLLKGVEEGEEKTLERMVMALLTDHEDIERISKLTGLPKEKIEILKQKAHC